MIWLIFSLITVVVVQRLPARYSSEALILVDSQKIPENYVAATVSTELQDRIATISQQILSATQLKKVIEDFDLYHKERQRKYEEEIIEMVRGDISIRLERGWTRDRPGAFRVGYQGTNPEVVAQVANRLANLFIDENLKTREVQAVGTSEFIDNQLQEAKKNLDQQEAALSSYKVSHVGELPQQAQELNGALTRLQVELEANRDAINRADQSKLVLENTLNALEATVALMGPAKTAPVPVTSPVGGSAIRDASGSSPGVVSLRRSDVLQAQLDQLRLRYSDSHPDVRRLTGELARVKATEEKENAAVVPTAKPEEKSPATLGSQAGAPQPAMPVATVQAIPNPDPQQQAREKVESLKSQIQLANKEMEGRKQDQKRILVEIANYQNRISKLPIREQEMAKITRDYDISQLNYKSLLDKKFNAEMGVDMERRQKSEKFTILDPARVSAKPIKPQRLALAVAGSGLSLVLGLLFAFGKELSRGRLLGEWELPLDGTAILARVPNFSLAEPRRGWRGGNMGTKMRVAILSSALLSLLGMIAVAVVFAMKGV